MSDTTTLLIVDDSRVSRMMVRAMVKNNRPEWTIFEAGNSDEALAIAEVEQSDIMIIDHNMPGMLGMDLAAVLKKQFPDAAITLLTANIQESIQRKATDLGIGFTKKPVNEAKIQAILNTVDG